MMEKNENREQLCAEYLHDLYALAATRYRDAEDVDGLVMDSMLVLLMKWEAGETVEHPRAFLSAVMKNKYNETLRRKYRNRVVQFPGGELADTQDLLGERQEEMVRSEEYVSVRREVGRLIGIYREVTVRYYMDGQSVERIARDLGIAEGTVKSRLFGARTQIREGLNKMEKYARISYAPKKIGLGIWGGLGLRNEPFSLVGSAIESNILWLAYEKPISLRQIADTMGMPAAYVEPLVCKLVEGELMGRTEGGLVFTRCFMQERSAAFGDIPAQEKIAAELAPRVWEAAWSLICPLTDGEEYAAMTEKQRVTLLLHTLMKMLMKVKWRVEGDLPYRDIPERPNGGRWLALATVEDETRMVDLRYVTSGPAQVSWGRDAGKNDVRLSDFQSVFGDAHFAYGRFPYTCTLQDAARLYASFLNPAIRPENSHIYELIPEFEALHILRRDVDGQMRLDIPALTFSAAKAWEDAIDKGGKRLYALLEGPLSACRAGYANRVPAHVDCRERFLGEGALGAYTAAQLLAIAEQGLLPYPVRLGETPIICVHYREA